MEYISEMAEVAKSVVSEPEKVDEDVSLQELIDSELALRVPAKNHSFTKDFLTAEREHSDASSPPLLSVLALNQQNLNNNHNNNNNSEKEDEWTTVEEVAKDLQEDLIQNHDDSHEEHVEIIEETNETVETVSHGDVVSNGDCIESETVESSVTKKKKKNSIGEGDTVVTKTKKTKKTKKTEEKENHISVMTNGHNSTERSPSPPPVVKDDELSNVCVRNLKLNYVNVANKSVETKPSEIPVPPAVSIRELRRSFGDIHKACENSDNQIINDVQLAATYWRTVSIENNLNEEGTKRIGRLDKSSFSKFDQLSKKVLHVRSSDPAKASKTFNQGSESQTSTCKACGKTVFAMEQIKAEKAVWHKNCFRCQTCNKQLTVDIYSSHEGTLYCKPHFKELFKPKVVVEDEEPASDKPDLGLEELSSLNVKSRFQVFEKQDAPDGEIERSPTTVSVKRSSSILSKLAKFQKKGMDVGVSNDALAENGFVYEASSSSSEEEDDEDEEETGIVKCRRKNSEKPVAFVKIDDVKKNWESQTDQATRREMMREQKREELQALRSRMFQGKQGKMKELYEQAVAESEGKPSKNSEDIVRSEKAKAVREKFEKGETVRSDDEEEVKKKVDEDMSVFEEGISKKSRSLFLQMDANVAKSQSVTALAPPPKEPKAKMAREVYYSRQASDDVVKSSDVVEDVIVQTEDLSSKFKFFETYKPKEKEKRAFRITPPREGQVKTESPEREVYRDPDVVRCDDRIDDEQTVKKSMTTSKMLSMFRQLEEQKEVIPEGPKPKKCFTPPPDYRGSESEETEEEGDEDEEEDEEEEEDSEREDGVVKSSYKVKDEFLEQARNAAKAKQLAAKFESWEPDKQSTNNAINMLDSEHASIDSTKSLRAKFESLKTEQPKEKSRPKVNRFVEAANMNLILCSSCDTKVYQLEKVETNGKTFHKQCFRCAYCKCILRMDTYTLNNGQLYCLPHFKQLFISKGNYDEGFGSNQHKHKWDTPAAN